MFPSVGQWQLNQIDIAWCSRQHCRDLSVGAFSSRCSICRLRDDADGSMLQTRKFHLKPIFVFNILFLLKKKNFPKDQYLQKPQITLKTDRWKTRKFPLETELQKPEIPICIYQKRKISLIKQLVERPNKFPYIETDSCKNRKFPFEPIGGKTGNFPLKPIAWKTENFP